MELHPYHFCLFFCLFIFPYLLSKTLGCFSGCLISSSSIQKLFCGIYSAFKCSFDEFVGEKVVSPSYSSTILGMPLPECWVLSQLFQSALCVPFYSENADCKWWLCLVFWGLMFNKCILWAPCCHRRLVSGDMEHRALSSLLIYGQSHWSTV